MTVTVVMSRASTSSLITTSWMVLLPVLLIVLTVLLFVLAVLLVLALGATDVKVIDEGEGGAAGEQSNSTAMPPLCASALTPVLTFASASASPADSVKNGWRSASAAVGRS